MARSLVFREVPCHLCVVEEALSLFRCESALEGAARYSDDAYEREASQYRANSVVPCQYEAQRPPEESRAHGHTHPEGPSDLRGQSPAVGTPVGDCYLLEHIIEHSHAGRLHLVVHNAVHLASGAPGNVVGS